MVKEYTPKHIIDGGGRGETPTTLKPKYRVPGMNPMKITIAEAKKEVEDVIDSEQMYVDGNNALIGILKKIAREAGFGDVVDMMVTSDYWPA